MENIQLRNPDIRPTNEVLSNILGISFSVYTELMDIITNQPYCFIPEWNYYNDGKAWLCKVCYKKKTIFWLSVWDQYFKIAFYFTEKTKTGLFDLNIEPIIKESFKHEKSIGKLLPLVILMKQKDQLADLLTIANYKKSLK